MLFWILSSEESRIPKKWSNFSPAFLIPVGLWAWEEFTRVCPGGSRLASARLGWPSIIWGMWMRDAWPAHGGRGRWPVSVISGTHTYTHSPHPPLSPLPDDLLVSMLIKQKDSNLVLDTGFVSTLLWGKVWQYHSSSYQDQYNSHVGTLIKVYSSWLACISQADNPH